MYAYLASRYSRRLEMVERAAELKSLGHQVTSTWITGKHETRPGIDEDATDAEKQVWAQEDVEDVFNSTAIISFTEDGRNLRAGRGGRHVELGIAVGMNKMTRFMPDLPRIRLIVVGPKEHVFHTLPEIEHFENWNDCLAQLEREGR